MTNSKHNPAPDLRLEMLSQARLLAPARSMVGTFAQRIGFSEVMCGQISLAVDEALCNVINHGYDRRPDGPIWLNLWGRTREDDAGQPGMTVVIEDMAKQVDPAEIKSRDLAEIRPGGLGVYIIREIMNRVTYEHRPEGGMRLTLVKHLESDEHAATQPADASARKAESQS